MILPVLSSAFCLLLSVLASDQNVLDPLYCLGYFDDLSDLNDEYEVRESKQVTDIPGEDGLHNLSQFSDDVESCRVPDNAVPLPNAPSTCPYTPSPRSDAHPHPADHTSDQSAPIPSSRGSMYSHSSHPPKSVPASCPYVGSSNGIPASQHCYDQPHKAPQAAANNWYTAYIAAVEQEDLKDSAIGPELKNIYEGFGIELQNGNNTSVFELTLMVLKYLARSDGGGIINYSILDIDDSACRKSSFFISALKNVLQFNQPKLFVSCFLTWFSSCVHFNRNTVKGLALKLLTSLSDNLIVRGLKKIYSKIGIGFDMDDPELFVFTLMVLKVFYQRKIGGGFISALIVDLDQTRCVEFDLFVESLKYALPSFKHQTESTASFLAWFEDHVTGTNAKIVRYMASNLQVYLKEFVIGSKLREIYKGIGITSFKDKHEIFSLTLKILKCFAKFNVGGAVNSSTFNINESTPIDRGMFVNSLKAFAPLRVDPYTFVYHFPNWFESHVKWAYEAVTEHSASGGCDKEFRKLFLECIGIRYNMQSQVSNDGKGREVGKNLNITYSSPSMTTEVQKQTPVQTGAQGSFKASQPSKLNERKRKEREETPTSDNILSSLENMQMLHRLPSDLRASVRDIFGKKPN